MGEGARSRPRRAAEGGRIAGAQKQAGGSEAGEELCNAAELAGGHGGGRRTRWCRDECWAGRGGAAAELALVGL